MTFVWAGTAGQTELLLSIMCGTPVFKDTSLEI